MSTEVDIEMPEMEEEEEEDYHALYDLPPNVTMNDTRVMTQDERPFPYRTERATWQHQQVDVLSFADPSKVVR